MSPVLQVGVGSVGGAVGGAVGGSVGGAVGVLVFGVSVSGASVFGDSGVWTWSSLWCGGVWWW